MHKKKKQILILMLAAMTFMSACSAAPSESDTGDGGEGGGSTTAGDDGSGELDLTIPGEYTLPLVDEPTTITWATVENWYPNASYNDNLPIHQIIAETTNITIEWEVLPDAQYTTSMQTRLAAGNDLPDILRVPGGNPVGYGQQKLLIPLNDLISEHGYGVKQVFEQYPLAASYMKGGDGNYYGLAPIIIESSMWMPRYLVMREDWLNDLGLDTPETTEDWVEVLTAFRDNDMNGNGDPSDEIPYASDPLAFGGAFGLHLMYSSDDFFATEEGEVYYQPIDPRMKELLTFLNELYEEGLLNPDYGNPDSESESSLITQGIVGASYQHADLAMSYGTMLRDSIDDDAWLVAVAPPEGPNGDQSIEGYGTVDMGYQSISKDCENPEAAFKLMDWFWTEEGKKYMAYGIEDVSYEYDENNEIVYTEEALTFTDGVSAFLRTLGAWPTTPWVQQERSYILQLENDPKWGVAAAEETLHPYYVEPFPMLLSTDDEQQQMAVPLEDIRTHVNENITKFILGTRPLEEFDIFVSEVEGIGLQEILNIKQAQWDAAMS